jgi:endonuclease YncB( thermonuclease family)
MAKWFAPTRASAPFSSRIFAQAPLQALLRGTVIVLLIACPCTGTTAAEVIVGPARVVDGDTIQLRDARVRLEGIDAPEAKQTCINARGREWDCGRAASQNAQGGGRRPDNR